ncbi:MAG TPA: DinB family protein [Isosphaeraceae bacterium]|jgi:hypothetical protein|nr:DinB family protein [Isosphaeraceae bacterium]
MAEAAEVALLLALLDSAYDKKAWHGPNLKGSVRGLSPSQASWRPASGRKCIAEIVAHAAYWKYAVRRRLTGAKRGSFAIQGSNWFPLPAPWDRAAWVGYVKLLDAEHRALRGVVAGLAPGDLGRRSPGSKYVASTMIQGIAAHDLYHAGQIQLLKRLMPKT